MTNLFADLPPAGAAEEVFATLAAAPGARIERIVSAGRRVRRASGTIRRRTSGSRCWRARPRSASRTCRSRWIWGRATTY